MKVTIYDNGTYKEVEVAEATPTAEELQAQRLAEIEQLKAELAATDYRAIKFAEGWLTPEEYARTKDERQQMRDRINQLEGEYASE